MTEPSFDKLPEIVNEINKKLDLLIGKLSLQDDLKPSSDVHQLMTITEAADFLRLSKATVYSLVSLRKIPHSKNGKRLYFQKAELLAWIRLKKNRTLDEISSDTEEELIKHHRTRSKQVQAN